MARKAATQIPPKPVVRVVACVLLIVGIVTIYFGVTLFSALGWPAVVLFLGGFSTVCFASVSLITGDPEWILLDLIIPG